MSDPDALDDFGVTKIASCLVLFSFCGYSKGSSFCPLIRHV